MLAERAIEQTLEGEAALAAGGTLIARRALADGRSEFLLLACREPVFRGALGATQLRAFIDASSAAGERVRCAPLRRERGGRRVLFERAMEVR